jgi:hypothetical protein
LGANNTKETRTIGTTAMDGGNGKWENFLFTMGDYLFRAESVIVIKYAYMTLIGGFFYPH